jgi:hypothetical protein
MTPTMEVKEAKGPNCKQPFAESYMKQHPQYFDSLLRNNDFWQIKIIYTQVDRKAGNKPVLRNYYFNIDPKQYFYPPLR